MALPGAFSQIPDPTNSGPAWSAGGAQYSSPYCFVFCVLEKKNQVSTIFLYRKINNKKVTDNDLIDWRAYGVETLTKPKQTKPKRKHKQNLGIRLYSCYRLW